jgi:hypothetical protein
MNAFRRSGNAVRFVRIQREVELLSVPDQRMDQLNESKLDGSSRSDNFH